MTSRLTGIEAKVMCCSSTMSVEHSTDDSLNDQDPFLRTTRVASHGKRDAPLFGQVLTDSARGGRRAYSSPGPARGLFFFPCWTFTWKNWVWTIAVCTFSCFWTVAIITAMPVATTVSTNSFLHTMAFVMSKNLTMITSQRIWYINLYIHRKICSFDFLW